MSSPDNLAVESEYYRLRQLDERDKKVVRGLCVNKRLPLHADIAESMLAFLDHPYDYFAKIYALFPGVDAAPFMKAIEVNYVEDFFALIESKMCPILEKLRARDLSSTSCPDEAPWLAFFLATQYFRTKTMEHRILSVLDEDLRSAFDCDWGRVWGAMRVILACQVGASLHAQFDCAAFTIMEAPRGVNLITSDQPLFNIKSHLLGPDGLVQKFALYFPITPEFAVLCDLNSTDPGTRTDLLPEGNARYLNTRMADEAFRQVFARRSEELDLLQ